MPVIDTKQYKTRVRNENKMDRSGLKNPEARKNPSLEEKTISGKNRESYA